MSRTRRFLSGLVLSYVNVVMVTLVGLWLTRFLLHRLGESDYGLWLIVAQVLAYLLLMDIGVVALLPREIAYATGRAGSGTESHAQLRAIGTRTMAIVMWQVPVVAVVSVVVLLLFPAAWAPLRLPFSAVLAGFVFFFPLRVYHALLRGLQDLAFLSITNTVSWAAGTIVIVTLVLAGAGLYALATGWVVTQAVSGLAWWGRLRRRYPQVLPAGLARVRWTEAKRHLASGGWISTAQIAEVFVAGTDLLILGRVIGPAAVVLYFCTGKVISVLRHQPQMLMEAAQPGLSEMKTGTSRDRLQAVCTALAQAMLLLSGAVACVVVGVNDGFVRWWVGGEFYGGAGLTAALLGAMLLRHWNVTTVYALFAFGKERRIAITTLADGIVTIASQLVLALLMGPLGVALGAMVGVVFVSLPANLIGLGRETGNTVALAMAPLPWAWRFGLALALAVAFAARWTPSSFVSLAAATLVLTLVYVIVVAPLALRGELGSYTRQYLFPLWHRVTRALGFGASHA
ncbi:MAG TPA: oligosaccharide flippase family protein [Gemmatimonadales bacterium]